MEKKKDKLFITLIALDILVVIAFFLTYGPINYFRNLWITSSMKTATHQYLAYIFYNDEVIEKTMGNNVVVSFKDKTNANAIKFTNTDNITNYANAYEEQVLKKDPGNDLYKVIKIDYNKNSGYLLVVYDSSRLSLENSKKNAFGGQFLTKIAESYGAIAAVNASGFSRNKSTYAITPVGTTIQDGKIISKSGGSTYGRGLIGFNYDNVLVLTYEDPETAIANGMKDALTWGPFLIMNGEKAFIKGDGGWGRAPRTAIGQRKDGIVLFAVFNGRSLNSLGQTMTDLTDLLYMYGAYNAANLDGGGSSALVVNNELINDPTGWNQDGERYLCNAWILK